MLRGTIDIDISEIIEYFELLHAHLNDNFVEEKLLTGLMYFIDKHTFVWKFEMIENKLNEYLPSNLFRYFIEISK